MGLTTFSRHGFTGAILTIMLLAITPTASGQMQLSPEMPDIPAKFDLPTSSYDYVRREVMIPMRDGVKLFTVIVIPKGAKNAPMILTRTPYNAADRARRMRSPHMLATLPQGDEVSITQPLTIPPTPTTPSSGSSRTSPNPTEKSECSEAPMKAGRSSWPL
jgi:hypothetical protein